MDLDHFLNIEKIKCTGCGVCKSICPSAAISMARDLEGFWYPDVDEDRCSACGSCINVCPISQEIISENQNESQVEIYAAWSLDKENRFLSTSGGIFSEFALAVLKEGGVVCGASYDGVYEVRHVLIDNRAELEKLRQSKYVQSNMGEIYKEIAAQLSQGKSLLFCGNPCQCQAVFNYCKECKVNIEKLYLIDFICRGSNSPKVYEKFLKELEKEYQSVVNKVWFKNKTYGWNCFSTKIEFENGASYLKDRYHDTFIRGYIEENLYIRPSCADCNFKGFNRISDITLGDFWGVQLRELSKERDGGTSMVMLHTEKGKGLWNTILDRVWSAEKTLKEVTAGNSCFAHSVKYGEHREEFMKDLDRIPVIENIERFLKNV